jgi:hypothetical protein
MAVMKLLVHGNYVVQRLPDLQSMMHCRGVESLVRFNNNISDTYFTAGSTPCTGKRGRPRGRPISIHLHGSASLPPYDGWADDVTCTGESKDYIYPNEKSRPMWYHDHAFRETAANAYFGEYSTSSSELEPVVAT